MAICQLYAVAIARSNLVDPNIAYAYHLISRCVRRSFLCGQDSVSGKDYSHRKDWIINRIKQLAPHFPIDVYAYSIMSNHLHMVVFYDPNAHKNWSPEEVARRWCSVCPRKKRNGTVDEASTAVLYNTLLTDEVLREHKRTQLGSLSTFMKLLKQPIATKANQEDGCSGHFFEQRYYSGALLSEAAVIAAMAYVDLNPVRAKLAKHLREIEHASITQRIAVLQNNVHLIEDTLDRKIQPLLSGAPRATTSPPPALNITVREYVNRLELIIDYEAQLPTRILPLQNKVQRWIQQVQTLAHRQRAYGTKNLIEHWLASRNMQYREVAMGD